MSRIVHIGLPKAASTYLQAVWHFSPRHRPCDIGPFLSDARERIKRQLAVPAMAMDAAWQEASEPVSLISNEGLCQAFLNETGHQRAVVDYQREVAHAVGQSGFARHALLLVREPRPWLRSLYEQSLKQGGHWYFREFLTQQRAFVEAVSDLGMLVSFWQEAGLEVTLLPLEWLRDDEVRFWNTLEARTGCPAPPAPARQRARKGRSWRNASVGDRRQFLLMANRFLFRLGKIYGDLKRLPPELDRERMLLARQFSTSAHAIVRRVAEYGADRDIDRLLSNIVTTDAGPDADEPPESLIAHMGERYVGFLERRADFPAELAARYRESLDFVTDGNGALHRSS